VLTWTWDEAATVLARPLDDQLLINILACASWIGWAVFLADTIAAVAGEVQALRLPTRPRAARRGPMRAATAALVAATVVTLLGERAGAARIAATPAADAARLAKPAAAASDPGATAAAPAAAAERLHATMSSQDGNPRRPATSATSAWSATSAAQARVAAVPVRQHDQPRRRWCAVRPPRDGVHDSLWRIAGRELGDPARWPEIFTLNRGRLQPDGGRLVDPDLIYPGWILRLPPEQAPPPPPARRSDPRPAAPPESEKNPPRTAPPTGGGSEPASPQAPSATPATAPPAPAPAAAPGPEPALSPTAKDTHAGTDGKHHDDYPGDDPGDNSADDQEADDQVGDGDGVEFPNGSWVPWTVAGAVVSAMAVVWLQRRRRHVPRSLDDPDALTDAWTDALTEPPPVVRTIQRAWRRHARAQRPALSEPPINTDGEAGAPIQGRGVAVPEVPPIESPPAGGLGLVGPGAEAAARGALVAALAAGGSADPDARTEAVIPAATLVTLLGAGAVALGGWSRLHVTADLDTALAVLEARLLHAARLLDEHEVADVAALRRAAPYEEPLPPLLLIADTPAEGARARVRTVLGLGATAEVTAVLLGEWAHGPTVTVDPDGACRPHGGEDLGEAALPERMAVLDTSSAYDLLRTLREAHTGEPDTPARASGESGKPVPGAGQEQSRAATLGDAAHDDEKTPGVAPAADIEPPTEQDAGGDRAAPKAVVRVLGRPRIEDPPAGLKVRSAAIELMVYLAVHRDGAHADQVMDELLPEVRHRLAAGRLHTAASNLRHLLAGAAGDADPGDYVVKERGRYRLNPRAVDVDLWRLRAACARAAATRDPSARLAALREACRAYRGELAEGCDYDWITSHRQGVRVLGVDAHAAAAAAVADSDPGEAARLLRAAVEHDPANEEVCQQAMRAYAHLGDAEAIRSLLRQLALALDGIGVEPSEDTVALADDLRRDLDDRRDRVASTDP
jgi:DNA-binding SARP family transcriptional activator